MSTRVLRSGHDSKYLIPRVDKSMNFIHGEGDRGEKEYSVRQIE